MSVQQRYVPGTSDGSGASTQGKPLAPKRALDERNRNEGDCQHHAHDHSWQIYPPTSLANDVDSASNVEHSGASQKLPT